MQKQKSPLFAIVCLLLAATLLGFAVWHLEDIINAAYDASTPLVQAQKTLQ